MRIFTNHSLVRHNHNLGRALVFIGMASLAGGFVISFTNPEAVLVVLAAAFAGTLISQTGITFLNRWGRHPRPDEIIDSAMKGLDDRFAAFHYCLDADHVVTGPAGTYAVMTRKDQGDIVYEDESFYQVRPKGGLLRRGGRTELKALASDATRQAESALSAIHRRLDDAEDLKVAPIAVFISDDVSVQTGAEVGGLVILHRSKLKDWLRRAAGGIRLSKTQVDTLADALGLEAD